MNHGNGTILAERGAPTPQPDDLAQRAARLQDEVDSFSEWLVLEQRALNDEQQQGRAAPGQEDLVDCLLHRIAAAENARLRVLLGDLEAIQPVPLEGPGSDDPAF
jgi:hypothetical protein